MDGKIITVVLMLTVAGVILVNGLVLDPTGPNTNNNTSNLNDSPPESDLKKFNSPDEIASFLKEKEESGGYRGYGFGSLDMAVAPMMGKSISVPMMAESSIGTTSAPSPNAQADDFSTTNIQVAGVDEADIVKNDGKYIYALSGNTVSIVDAYPPEDAEILSKIEIEGTPQEIFINKDRLIVLGNDYDYIRYADAQEKRKPSLVAPEEFEPYPGRIRSQFAVLYVYDIADRSEPELVREVFVDGNYFDSRMVGDYVYIIASQYTRYYDDLIAVPEIADSVGADLKPDVYYFDAPDYSYSFTTIASVNAQDEGDAVHGKIYLLGSAQAMFVSQENVYITYQRMMPRPVFYEKIVDSVIEPLVPIYVSTEIKRIQSSDKSDFEKGWEIEKIVMKYFDSLSDVEKQKLEELTEKKFETLELEIAKETEKTIVHKIAIEDGKIEYMASGKVPGRVLNQFSMDEHNGYFRIATTTGHVSRNGDQYSANHIYVLDSDLEIEGVLEDLAPGERIYSARFMGKRAYLVTFQKVDPLFVIDLSEPKEPRVLGKLKIPGYSDYLHPYDENHIIGLGKDAVAAEDGDFAWYRGLKLALFDVSDVNRPKEVSKVVIGDRGTDSYALQDHKAFLFSREKNLLVIPVLLAEIDSEKYPNELPEWTYGDYVWQGAYVFSLDTERGFKLKGKVSHNEDSVDFLKSGRYYYGSGYAIKRSLYMDDVLYTLSDGMIKMNGLDDLKEINRVRLPAQEVPIYGYIE
jgi:uncharacterized secreted protein with C-terminal beta-propeller domain